MKTVKLINPVGRWQKYGRRAVLSIMPPIISTGIRKMRDKLLRHNMQSTLLPSSEYSTLDNPLEVPVQVEAYLLCRDKYLKPTDFVLDVRFGLGYGLQIMATKVTNLIGLEVDAQCVDRGRRLFEGHPHINKVMLYNGKILPFRDKTFDVVICSEVIEHVEDYEGLLLEMVRVARRSVFISTPNRRPENTLANGRPKNYWHLREWTKDELDIIFKKLGFTYEWNFINGCFEGPFTVTTALKDDTWSLIPIIYINGNYKKEILT